MKTIAITGASGFVGSNLISHLLDQNYNIISINREVLNDEQKERLLKTLKNRLTKDFVLLLQCDESRSQHKNKAIVIERFLFLIKDGIFEPKKRKPTKIPKSVIAKRLKNKSTQSEKKANRKKPNID